MKSWPGLLEFCNPSNFSGFKSIINILFLKENDVRIAILDLLFELVGLQVPHLTTDYTTALTVLDPCEFQDSWRLNDGFVAMEGMCILPNLAPNISNIAEIHLALLLYCFQQNNLFEALVEVIVSSEIFLSVRTTVLLGKLLQLCHFLLPNELNTSNQALPLLYIKASEGSFQAKSALTSLQNFTTLLKNRPAVSSLYLDQIVQGGSLIQSNIFNRELKPVDDCFHLQLSKAIPLFNLNSGCVMNKDTNCQFSEVLSKYNIKRDKIVIVFDHAKDIEKLIRHSCVLTHVDPKEWDWDIIMLLLSSEILHRIDEITIKFIRELVNYFKPSCNRFSHEELPLHGHLTVSILVGLELIDWLLKCQELDSIRLLTDFFTDISNQLLSITTSRSVHDCLFSPQHMTNTMCQLYFLFIGKMSKNDQGLNILTNTDIFKQ